MAVISAKKHITLYVYYKIPANDRNSYLLAVNHLYQTIKLNYPNLILQHQKRLSVDAENKETWMETYAGITNLELEKFTMHLTTLAEKYGLPKERKYEVFINSIEVAL